MAVLSLFFAALSDENRLRLLFLMRKGEVCVCHFQKALGTNQPKISRHLAYLRKTGLVDTRRKGTWRYYRLAKLERPLAIILEQTFSFMKKDPQIRKDNQKLKRVSCSPNRSRKVK